MSLLPYVFDDIYTPGLHHFGLGGYHPGDFWVIPAERSLMRSLENTGNYLRSQLSNVDGIEKKSHIGKDGFQVCLDVKHFQPNEISVKTENNSVIVHAKHEEKRDNHGFISREFTRRYDLPEGFKTEDITSSLSSDGILSINAPHITPAIEGNVRHIQIQQTGPARLSISKNEEDKENKCEKKKSK